MQANQNAQLSGGCRELPGANERVYAVGGRTYFHRNYLKGVGLRWDPVSQLWTGRLGRGRAWFMRVKLGLEVVLAGSERVEAPSKPRVVVHLTPEARKRLRWIVGQRPSMEKGVETGWEAYSAMPVATSRDVRVQEGLNINLRDCYWGRELCPSCMECVSNIDENDILPHPEIDFWDSEEERTRENAVFPVMT